MTILVTGAGGFLGQAIVRRLRHRGLAVRGLNRRTYPALQALDVEQIQGDIADRETVFQAVSGCEAVFHVAALAAVWGKAETFDRINTGGTRNVIEACRQFGVRRLVYTSSPSVTFDGSDQEGVDESAPYPQKFLAHYPRTKAAAEQLINQANDRELATVSLRPHLIWGPGDNHLLPRLLERHKANQLKIVGDGGKLVDSVYIDNAADAHLAAFDRLDLQSAIGGKNYFISNGEPKPMGWLINQLLQASGLSSVKSRVSAGLAYTAGAVLEGCYRWMGLKTEPRMTRFVARQLATAHWFDINAAKRDLGYRPVISIEEGLRQLAAAQNPGHQ